VDGVPGLPVVAHAVDLGPALAGHHEEDGVPGVAVDRGDRARIDFVHMRVEDARRPVAVAAHVDAGTQAAGGRTSFTSSTRITDLAIAAPSSRNSARRFFWM
jgi:hypothetical protein